MSEKRDIRLDEYGLSNFRYRELKYFCLQYAEKKEALKALRGLRGISYTYSPKTNKVISEVENKAVKAAELEADIKLIEEAAAEADDFLYPYILKNAADDIPYEYMDVPCGRRHFYEVRRYFFFLLSKKKGN